jgi:tetratricopeptide (TPR) repeat protein
MTQYGMGAIKLYQQKFDEAEALLQRALVETTLAEPHILLSQLYWKHRSNYTAAIRQLERIEHTSSPRREVMQNLGLLLMATGAAPTANATARGRADYLILLGHAAHGYPMGHPNIGLLASNAACVRTLSERFASPALAESLFEEALKFRHSSRITALKNQALFYGAQGRPARASAVAEEAIAYIGELRDRPEQSEEGRKQAAELIEGFRVLQLSLAVHAPAIEGWAEAGLAGGAAAEERLAYLGGDCSSECRAAAGLLRAPRRTARAAAHCLPPTQFPFRTHTHKRAHTNPHARRSGAPLLVGSFCTFCSVFVFPENLRLPSP